MSAPATVEFPSFEDLHRRVSAKWSFYDDDVLPMPVAEMDCLLAEPIARALHEAIDLGDCGYPPPALPLARAFAGFCERRWGWTVDPHQVVHTADVAAGVIETLRGLFAPGDRIVINTPVYPPFFSWPAEDGIGTVEVPMLETGDAARPYRLDLEGMERAFASGVKAYLMSSPHNPLGHTFSRDELVAVADLADRQGVLVLADEIHAPLTLPGVDFVPFLTVSDTARRVGVAYHSASKSFNLAGLKMAHLVTADKDLFARVRAALSPEIHRHVGTLGDLAGRAAFTDCDDWLDALRELLAVNHRTLQEQVAERLPQARILPATASYLAWLDLSAYDLGDEPADALLRVGRVALGKGTTFGELGRGHVRVNLGCPTDYVVDAVDRIDKTVQAVQAQRAGHDQAAG
ncbi:aminotransferase class I/II-fold pyridoxal phosphate-dependent enzyme [Arsenicicoccus piscis]|uniref:cysteine-S-conjugate beta-lyase n=1 Tax=Arsenicicoccus piscis TaxID=673954 RepID=A0ABQ6HPJ8_9MICO|nr:aminotransferase class I/II-fold pyridoxal phosphate-dependent enzyme [Arsenicicoccus piscis]MCH8629335.1 aminotransferase class I/II-fold pyridoxal phosphate-dependent enzyme [Arsenicicoccus piscis]GMA20395.1 cystathionine beta-lyase [Arsenicicoccus piscis]